MQLARRLDGTDTTVRWGRSSESTVVGCSVLALSDFFRAREDFLEMFVNYLSTGISFVNSMDHSRPITSYNSLSRTGSWGLQLIFILFGAVLLCFFALLACFAGYLRMFFLFSLMECTPEIPGGHLHPRLSDRGSDGAEGSHEGGYHRS